jgi:Arc/MetJ family transcription regulator
MMMRTNIVLDDKLVKEAFKLTDVKTKRDLVDLALRELVRTRQQRVFLKYKGIGWEGDLDELRSDRFGSG